MKQATFYILNKNTLYERYLFACRLTEKAYKQGLRVALFSDSQEVSRHIDDLLWTFRPDSFLPHDYIDKENPNTQAASVFVIAPMYCPNESFDIAINLGQQPGEAPFNCERHIEIAIQDPNMLKTLRSYYKNLNTQNIPIDVHDLTK